MNPLKNEPAVQRAMRLPSVSFIICTISAQLTLAKPRRFDPFAFPAPKKPNRVKSAMVLSTWLSSYLAPRRLTYSRHSVTVQEPRRIINPSTKTAPSRIRDFGWQGSPEQARTAGSAMPQRSMRACACQAFSTFDTALRRHGRTP